MDSIILSKYLYVRANECYMPSDDMTYGLTVSLLQDSAEMLIWHMAKFLNIQSKPKDGFVSLIENIDKNHCGVAFKQKIFELNQARVNFKHYGILPSKLDMPKFLESCEQFLVENSEKIGTDFHKVSSADTVNHPEIRGLLRNSEKALQDAEIEGALIQTSLAFQELEKQALKNNWSSDIDIVELQDSWEIWPSEHHNDARRFTKVLSRILEETINRSALGSLGYSPDYVNSIKEMCFTVNVTVSGKIVGVHAKPNTKVDIDSVKLINSFIIDAARKI